MDWSTILHLAFQSIGVVYGDVGTSPLYVYSSTFPNGISHNDDILGVLSLIFYTITLITLIKYVLIVLWANDNGEGMVLWKKFSSCYNINFWVVWLKITPERNKLLYQNFVFLVIYLYYYRKFSPPKKKKKKILLPQNFLFQNSFTKCLGSSFKNFTKNKTPFLNNFW